VPDGIAVPGNATVHRFVPHGVVLDRAVAAITHGGMGSTQKALARGVEVCVVPYGRDQFEVARRVEVARCGTRLTAKKLSPARLKVKVLEAMSMTTGAQRVADEFKATGGVVRGADLIERRLLGARPKRSGPPWQQTRVRLTDRRGSKPSRHSHNPLVAGSSPARPTHNDV
jgi:UDP:flavonoid glycosyltransferase YjiC (YdhE family)